MKHGTVTPEVLRFAPPGWVDTTVPKDTIQALPASREPEQNPKDDASEKPKQDIFLTQSRFTLQDCWDDLGNTFPSTYNPFARVATMLRKGNLPIVTVISSLDKHSDWNSWNNAVLALLGNYNLLGWCLDLNDFQDAGEGVPWRRPIPCPVPRNNYQPAVVAYRIWQQFDEVVVYVLNSRLGDDVLREAITDLRETTSPTSRDWYRVLRARYGRYSFETGKVTWRRAQALTCGMGLTSILNYLTTYKRFAQDIKESEFYVEPTTLITTFLLRLPQQFGSLYTRFLDTFTDAHGQDRHLPEFNDVLNWIDKAERYVKLYTADHIATGRDRTTTTALPQRAAPMAAVAKEGHPIANAGATTQARGRFAGVVCHTCGKVGHTKAYCDEPGGDRAKAGKRAYVVGGDVDQDELAAAEEELDNGVVDDREPEELAGVANAFASIALVSNETQDQNTTVSLYFGPEPPPPPTSASTALVASSDRVEKIPRAVVRKHFIVIDTGCSQTIIIHRFLFHSFKMINLRVGTANEHPLIAYGCGTVMIPVTLSDGQEKVLVIPDCLYAPSCPVNLISVGQLTDTLGLRFLFGDSQTVCWEHKPGARPTAFLSFPRHRRLTVLRTSFILPTPSLSRDICLVVSDGGVEPAWPLTFRTVERDIALWHRRFGHVGWDLVKRVLRGGVAKGVDYVGALESLKCAACIMGRVPAAPFSNNMSRADQPGDLLHLDISGPFPVPSASGNLYFVVILDDASNFGWSSLLRQRSDVVDVFAVVEAQLVVHTGRPVKVLRTDGAKELTLGRMKKYLERKGITHQVTAPYAHQQNGKAERFIGTIQRRASAILEDSGLPRSFWGWAILHALWLSNRLPTSTLPNGCSPYEMLFGRQPDFTDLRVFGCRCFVLTPRELRRKGDSYRSEAIFLGYESDTKGWRVMTMNRKVFVSHDVVFDEGHRGRLRALRPRVVNDVDGGGRVTAVDGEEVGPMGDAAVGMDVAITEISDGGAALRRSRRLAAMEEASLRASVEDVAEDVDEHNVDVLGEEFGVVMMATAEMERILAAVVVDETVEDVDPEVLAYFQCVGSSRLFDDEHHGYLSQLGRFRDVDGDEVSSSTAFATFDASKPPDTLREAMSRPDWPKWRAGMVREYMGLEERGAFEKVKRVPGMSVVSVRWVFAHKMNPDGSIRWDEEKARLVARGFSQRPGDYDETYAPVAKSQDSDDSNGPGPHCFL